MLQIVKKHGTILVASTSLMFSFLIFYKSLNYYFFQDDFYELLISKVTNTHDFLKLFTFQENRSSYRPIGLQLYYFVCQTLFGFNPTYFRIVTFILFFSTYFLIAKSIGKMLKDKLTGYLTGTFWITSSIHFLSLSWIAAAWLIIGSFFFFLTTNIYITYTTTQRRVLYALSLISFILTLGSFEFFIAWPVIMGIWLKLFLKKDIKYILKNLSPFIFIVFVYVITRLSLSSLPNISEYKIQINSNTLKQLFWYVLWSFNIPEEFKKQVINNLLSFNPVFIRDFGDVVQKSFVSMVAILLLGFFYPLVKCFKNKNNLNVVILCSTWFVISIMPVLVFPNHSFAMYLAIPSIGIYVLLGHLLSFQKNVYVISLVMLIWFYSSLVTVGFYRQVFWVVESQRFARQFSHEIKVRFPTIPRGSVVLYPLEDKRFQQAILNENAIKVLYNDPTIRIFFNEIDLNESINQSQIKPVNVLYFKN